MSGGGFWDSVVTIGGQIANTVTDAAGFVWTTVVPSALVVGGLAIVGLPFSIVAQLGIIAGGAGMGGFATPPFGGLMRGILDDIPILGTATIYAINEVNRVMGTITDFIGVPYVYIGWCSDDRCLIQII